MKPRVAIACQGGGSQTAFTGGVLKALFENKIQDHVNIVSLTGTSGGAICAFFIWYALRKEMSASGNELLISGRTIPRKPLKSGSSTILSLIL